MSSRELVRPWWNQGGHYRWLVHTIASRSALMWMKVVVGSGGMAAAVGLFLSAFSAQHAADRKVVLVFAAIATLWALRWWFLPVPVAVGSILLLGGADVFLTVVCVRSESYLCRFAGLVLLIAVGVYFTFFHSPKVLAAHAVWAVASAMVLLWPKLSGAEAIPALAVILAMSIVCLVLLPGLQFGCWLLWTDILSDPLTRVSSRRGLEFYARHLLYGGANACVLVIDLDRFKAINDTFGHHLGDEVLRNTAARLRAAAPSEAIVARIGGEEFAVLALLPPDRARVAAERLRRAVAEAADPVAVTASVGMACLAPDRPRRGGCGPTLAELMHRADAAMYRAKQQGGNAVAVDESGNPPAMVCSPDSGYSDRDERAGTTGARG
ncbi:GGDEF domain-containing protein [Nocardia sp. CDC159]|uniref:GGDEF domain-containing protein n=1 Tax=Nocardia pulmonis TaxID=2951408 RepID=A0A9X2E115_9NOCA|nr:MULTISPECIES: GGDEF domain-containing protein [Nocardia]MCM6772052.1 GGDEF domain-containing protein [Nocardia pulmonis]MCM6785290.1 GGDEF domain-containing protein [Nocardia sp. CDC159]